ncbi:MAG: hypothetical protein HY851_07285 [candidate division Zixibacteria bacterium]|nr:hypothetical protein [candidate division Zixibacteria bacterium]
MNCWEYHRCGREPGGDKVSEMGVCPAATSAEFAGFNHGRNAGRICWVVAGTFCAGKVQGLFAMKIENCVRCPFFNLVEIEEEDGFVLHPEQGVTELP